jgi:4a-hydroxytetrahydrobiopterin dehydratase
VHWTTHHPRGLSDKDAFMARYCDERAKEIGTVDKTDALKCAPTKPVASS